MSVDNPRTVAVTGASGFLGSEIVRVALRSGWQVRAVTRQPGSDLPEGAEVFCSAYEDTEFLAHTFASATAVVHSAGLAHVFGRAARDEESFLKGNEHTAASVALAARSANVPLFVLVSSVAVYGNYEGDIADETTPCAPQGFYARSKFKAEQRVSSILAGSATALIILRMATIYGEGDRGNVRQLIRAVDRGRFIWPGSGGNKKSLIYKRDAARACLAAASGVPQPNDQRIYVVSAAPQSMREIVETISNSLEREPPQLTIPEWLLKAAKAFASRTGDPGGVGMKLTKFTRNDAHNPKLFEERYTFRCETNLVDGLRAEIDAMHELARSGAHHPGSMPGV